MEDSARSGAGTNRGDCGRGGAIAGVVPARFVGASKAPAPRALIATGFSGVASKELSGASVFGRSPPAVGVRSGNVIGDSIREAQRERTDC